MMDGAMDGAMVDGLRRCADCGDDISDRDKNAKYCLECYDLGAKARHWRKEAEIEGNKRAVWESRTKAVLDDIERERDRVKKLTAENARLLSALDDAVGCWDENHCDVPEGPEVESICLKWGYGAVLQTAAELWRRKDPTGAHTVTACRYATMRARRVLDEIAPEDPDKPWAPRRARQ